MIADAPTATLAAMAVRAAQLSPAEHARRRELVAVAFTGPSCSLCGGSRRCPDCGGPCEVCTLR